MENVLTITTIIYMCIYIIVILYSFVKEKDIVHIEEIKISWQFRHSGVRKDKLKRKMDYYFKNKKFEDNIILNRNNKLLDGYSAYLIAKKLGIKEVEVLRDKKY